MSADSAIPITGAQRVVLRQLMAYRLFLSGERRLIQAHHEGIPHEQLAAEFSDDLRLMQDVGWNPEADGPAVIKMERRPLELALRRMRQDAAEARNWAIRLQPHETDEERAARFESAERVCDELLLALDHPGCPDVG
jgi:hypothetical protein